MSRVSSPTHLIIYRTLEEVQKACRVLLDKGKMAQFRDKRKDSETIVKLVEMLRQAILIYRVGAECYQDWPLLTRSRQASQQQSVHDLIVGLQVRFLDCIPSVGTHEHPSLPLICSWKPVR